jgi:hypothetical protein
MLKLLWNKHNLFLIARKGGYIRVIRQMPRLMTVKGVLYIHITSSKENYLNICKSKKLEMFFVQKYFLNQFLWIHNI